MINISDPLHRQCTASVGTKQPFLYSTGSIYRVNKRSILSPKILKKGWLDLHNAEEMDSGANFVKICTYILPQHAKAVAFSFEPSTKQNQN